MPVDGRSTASQEKVDRSFSLPVKGDEAYLLKRSILRNTGLPPTLLELGKALQQLIDLEQPIDEVVKCVPPSITTDPAKALRVAKKALDLNAAPLAVKRAVKEGKDGVRLSEPAAVKIARQNPLNPEPAIQAEVDKAKAAGKTTATRPKGAGKAAKAKEAVAQQHRALEKIGDEMADEIGRSLDLDKLERLAAEWHNARSR